MEIRTETSASLRRLQAVLSAPVLLAFTIGSLPVLLPVMLYRRIVRASVVRQS